MSEQNAALPRTCEACQQAGEDIERLNARVDALEHSCARMREGFPKNDLGNPGYDEHRVAHVKSAEREKVVSGYQRDMTKKVLEWILVAVGVLIGQGLLEWLKGHIK